MRISDWSSDVCSSDLALPCPFRPRLYSENGRSHGLVFCSNCSPRYRDFREFGGFSMGKASGLVRLYAGAPTTVRRQRRTRRILLELQAPDTGDATTVNHLRYVRQFRSLEHDDGGS